MLSIGPDLHEALTSMSPWFTTHLIIKTQALFSGYAKYWARFARSTHFNVALVYYSPNNIIMIRYFPGMLSIGPDLHEALTSMLHYRFYSCLLHEARTINNIIKETCRHAFVKLLPSKLLGPFWCESFCKII